MSSKLIAPLTGILFVALAIAAFLVSGLATGMLIIWASVALAQRASPSHTPPAATS
jgi:hypothetical protein